MTGFMGRIGIYETLLFTPRIKKLVTQDADLVAPARAGASRKA